MVALTVCCRLLLMPAAMSVNPTCSVGEHTKGGREKMAFCRKLSGTKRLLMKSSAEFRRDGKGCTISFQRHFLFSAFDAKENSFT